MNFAGITLKLAYFFVKFWSMSILAIRSNRRSETISMPSYGLKDQNWPIIFGIQLMRIHVLAFLKIPSVASKRVHVRKRHVLIGCKHGMFCRQTFEVWSRRLLSTWFVFAQQKILCKKFLTLRIISGGKCAVSEWEIRLKVEKNEIWGRAERADQKHMKNLPLARQRAV